MKTKINYIHISAADLTENFLKKILFFEFSTPTGLGGVGSVCMVSSDRKSYIFLVESCDYDYYEIYKIFPILKNYIRGIPPHIYYDFQRIQGDFEYFYIGYGSHLLIKKELYSGFLEKFLRAIQVDDSFYKACWQGIAIDSINEFSLADGKSGVKNEDI